MKKILIHSTCISWQERYFKFFQEGFRKHGFADERPRVDSPQPADVHVLFGPNYWKNCEKSYEQYLFVNRKLIGNVHDDVCISWNGFNGRGIFNVRPETWRADQLPQVLERSPLKVEPWRTPNGPPENFLLMGQADAGRSLKYSNLSDWYTESRDLYKNLKCIYRPWPGGDGHTLREDVKRTDFSVSLNSTVAVESLMLGQPTIVFDEGSPAWSICNPSVDPAFQSSKRIKLFEYIVNCQWHNMEIMRGDFWEQLSPGPITERLCDVKF